MRGLRHEQGFTLMDILIAIALVSIVTAMAIPMADSASRGFRMKGDAQSLANTVALAKMRAASRFSRTRVYADLNANSYRLEIWDKTALAWVIDGGSVQLSNGVSFGFGALDAPPPNTQDAIGQSPACTGTNSLTDDTVDNTACIVFNSRGVPVDNTTAGAPTGGNALYITDGIGVHATTVTATPLVRQWWSSASAPGWVLE
ncbi:MAG TPA: prepilin-type N-terminal cleavage/methylation domain-containing protein [Vicinamibacterales bacterium]|nr:prepilin-type N-terminal cleavage/methylation domain-containing protein [Vicinamibacterales bacterium]